MLEDLDLLELENNRRLEALCQRPNNYYKVQAEENDHADIFLTSFPAYLNKIPK